MTVLEVYRYVALCSILDYSSLEVLSHAWYTSSFDDHTWPSWVPKWDRYEKDRNQEHLLPFLYSASGQAIPMFKPIAGSNALSIRGVKIGTISEVNAVMDLRRLSHSQYRAATLAEKILALSRLLVQDRWQAEPGDENSAERSDESVRRNLSDAAAYFASLLATAKRDSYLALGHTWCDYCEGYIQNLYEPVEEIPSWYMCPQAGCGSTAACLVCYKEGKRCTTSVEHDFVPAKHATGIWIDYSTELLEVLRANATTGDRARFGDIMWMCMGYRTFVYTPSGEIGVTGQAVQPDDILVVLFGASVPFVLRRSASSYRLISDCYIHGYMDDEAMQMLGRGIFEAEDFEIV